MKSFRFKESWLKAVEAIADPAIQSELMLAIARYGINGTFTPSAGDTVNAVMAMIIAEAEAKNTRSAKADSETVDRMEQDLGLFDRAERQIDTMGMHASPDASRRGINVCFLRFRNECLAHGRFHSSCKELTEDFRKRISKEIYGIPAEETRFFRRKPAAKSR